MFYEELKCKYLQSILHTQICFYIAENNVGHIKNIYNIQFIVCYKYFGFYIFLSAFIKSNSEYVVLK